MLLSNSFKLKQTPRQAFVASQVAVATSLGFQLVGTINKEPQYKHTNLTKEELLGKLVNHSGSLAVKTGSCSNVIVIDTDVDRINNNNDGETTLAKWKSDNNFDDDENEPTLKVATPSGGYHYYYLYDESMGDITQFLSFLPGIDVKCNRVTITFPGSIYAGCKDCVKKCGNPEKCSAKNQQYKWLDGCSPDEVEIQPLPAFMKEAFLARAKKEKFARAIAAANRLVEIANGSNVIDDVKMQQIRDLCKMINAKCVDNYDDWMKIGWCLYTILDGSAVGLQLWKEVSATSKKYDEYVCDERWDGMAPGKWGIATLKHWAKICSPVAYADWLKVSKVAVSPQASQSASTISTVDATQILKATKSNLVIRALSERTRYNNPVMLKALNLGHNDVAVYIASLYKERFCYASEINKWYEFKAHRWQQSTNDHPLKALLSVEVCKEFELMIAEFKEHTEEKKGQLMTLTSLRGEEMTDDVVKQIASLDELLEEYETNIKKAYKLMNKLVDTGYKKNIMDPLKVIFDNNDFIKQLDQKGHLICFTNGVYDLEANVLRPGLTTDYISHCSYIDYPSEYTELNENVIAVREYLREVFVDDELRAYVVRWMSSCLKSCNTDKLFPQWIGAGDNSKSILINMLEQCFGNTSCTLNVNTFLQQKVCSTTATSDLNPIVGCKIAFMSEVPSNKPVDFDKLKRITGCDILQLRFLNHESKPHVNTAKVVLVANKAMNMATSCKAVWARTRIIDFESTFVKASEAPATREEQFKQKIFVKDVNFDKKLPTLSRALMWVLVQEYPKYAKDGLMECEKVNTATLNYKAAVDHFGLFRDEALISSDNSQTGVAYGKLYKAFNAWWRSSNRGGIIPLQAELMDGLYALDKKKIPKSNKYNGWLIKPDDDYSVSDSVQQVDITVV